MTNSQPQLIKDGYLRYLKSDEATAVYFVKNLESSIETKEKWIDVIYSEKYPDCDGKPAFKILTIELFKRKIKPKYPKDADEMLKKAITWKAAHDDIQTQRSNGIRGPVYQITGCSYNKNRGKFVTKLFDFWNEEYGGFDHTGKVPTTTIARRVKKEPKFVYRILGIKRIVNGV